MSWNPACGGHVCNNNPSCDGVNNGIGCQSGMIVNVLDGTTETFYEEPAPGYQFVSWSGDASGTSPTITMQIHSNTTVIANFEAIP